MPGKRRKSGALNYRLSNMLRQLDASLVAGPPLSGAKRARNPSSDTSSSTAVSATPPFTIDALHNSVRGKNLGENFTIIKNENSPFRSRRGYTGTRRLASWRDLDQQSKTEREDPELEIPTWLMQTFASLESDHPLRPLAVSERPSSVQDGDISTVYQGSPAPEETPNQDANYEKPVFAFTPPFINDSRREAVAGGLVADEDASGLSTVSNTLTTYADGLYALTDDDGNSDCLDAIPDFRPFAQPGPFVPKSVHFTTPSRSSPITDSDHSQANYSFARPKKIGTEPCDYNPFSTPGPAALFSLPSCDLGQANTTLENDHCSDPLTLASESMEGVPFAYGTAEENSATSVLSFASNPECSFIKPFSTPGPIKHPDKHSTYATVNYSDILPEPEQFSPDLREARKAIPIRFKIQEKDGAMRKPDAYNALEFAKDEALKNRKRTISPRILVNECVSESRKKPTTIPHEREDIANTSTIVELFSSPPYIRFKRANIPDGRACNYPLKNSVGPRGILGTPPSLPCAPLNCRTSDVHPQITTGPINEDGSPRAFDARAATRPMTPRPKKERSAFNPSSGVYVSPIRDPEYATASGKESRSSKTVKLDENIGEKLWNFSASQLSDDLIEEWAS